MSKKPKNPVKDEEGSDRVTHGGNWYYRSSYLPSARRVNRTPDYRRNFSGFRIVKNTPKKEKKDE